MMPDLGKYAEAVLTSYAVSLGLIAVLIFASVMRSLKVKAELEDVETRRSNDG
ncbi:heme exporter protein CcmD [Alisedimentitalea sp. MJ-SS2]|uniref:heme exporter protein CcmD n=1 Tax=Aliisedimentitalea sp. MJ-SS2 TaxID=3049795 RepID=UPI00290EBB48|nr:heme exporter protein CcmD [Alisedimentitalea sp. MJ-SS2]MDU8926414.1 heme exporter protein CcmD [Alisedimentitalea sp. MJ-SS2]